MTRITTARLPPLTKKPSIACRITELLTVPVAVSERRIDEIQSEFQRAVKRRERLGIGSSLPLFAADAPSAISDLADFEACFS